MPWVYLSFRFSMSLLVTWCFVGLAALRPSMQSSSCSDESTQARLLTCAGG